MSGNTDRGVLDFYRSKDSDIFNYQKKVYLAISYSRLLMPFASSPPIKMKAVKLKNHSFRIKNPNKNYYCSK